MMWHVQATWDEGFGLSERISRVKSIMKAAKAIRIFSKETFGA